MYACAAALPQYTGVYKRRDAVHDYDPYILGERRIDAAVNWLSWREVKFPECGNIQHSANHGEKLLYVRMEHEKKKKKPLRVDGYSVANQKR